MSADLSTTVDTRYIKDARPLTVGELTQANLQWLQQVQGLTFADEVANLKVKGRRLPLVRQLRLFLDSDGPEMWWTHP